MKNKSIRKTLPKLTSMMVVLFLLLIIPANIFIQFNINHNSQLEGTQEMFGQLEQVILANNQDIESEKQLFKDRCIRSADMVAYYVEYNKEAIQDINITRELAEILEVDEIHYFTPEGEIFAGTHPEYYGYNFDSGEQLQFFRPMLRNRKLKLCQDIMPNTAEGKEMQYAAVWMKDGSGMIQIGMEPRHIQQKIEEKSLQSIVSKMPFELNGYLHIIDKNTRQTIASTKESWLGKEMYGEAKAQYKAGTVNMHHRKFGGTWYCVYTKVYDDYILVRTYESLDVMVDMLKSSGLVVLYIILGSIGIIAIIRWYIHAKLIKNLNVIMDELEKLRSGSIESIDMKTNIPEFDELLMYLNQMLKSIKSSWNNLVYLMDRGELPIGIFEKNTFYKRTFVNERLKEILEVKEQELPSLEQTADFLEKTLIQIEGNEIDSTNHVYEYDRNGTTKYLHMEKLLDTQSSVYYVTDMTSWWREFHEAKEQIEIDALTGLYNRRGFYGKVKQLFETSKVTEYAAVIMADADNLKKINDCSGHYMGDQYLKHIAKSLKETAGENAVCARLGGDEFVVFLNGFSRMEDLKEALEHMKSARGKFFAQVQGTIRYTLQFSIGTAIYPIDSDDFHILMRIADKEMYREKRFRKNGRADIFE